MELKEQDKKYLEKAVRLCAAEERCADDIERKLSSWNLSPTAAKQILDFLYENNYLNEVRYATTFAEGKMRQLKWGRTKIAYQLRMKRVDDKAIEEGLLALDAEEYRSILKKLAEQKWKSVHESDDFVKRGKVTAYLQSHGFEMYEIQNVLENIEKE